MIGQTISHYKILEKLGGGGMGVVYKAEDTKLKRFVALKFLPPDLTRDEEAKERFVQEAQAASALDHPNICTIYEIDETEDGQMFIAMAYYEGETLKKKVSGGQLPVNSIMDIAVQVAQGLAKAHQKGIVHRDIKPANILVTSDGLVKILDFGLAKLAGAIRLTKTGATLGTPAYLSPEQAPGIDADHRTDIWALGVVLYEMLTGQTPFAGEYDHAVIYSILNEEPRPLSGLRAGAPAELESIVKKAIAKNFEARYQSMDEVLADLQLLKIGLEPVKSKSRLMAKELHRRKSRYLFGGIGGALLLSLLAGYFSMLPMKTAVASRKSVAVLPFKNLSDNKDDEYFSDGITDDIITRLSKIRDLKVISRTSVMHYKNSTKRIPEISKELKIATVLEGSVRRVGNRVRIASQLIDARNDEHLWAESYDREMQDIFEIQSEVAQQIATALEAELGPDEKIQLARRETENLQAYSLYLKGLYFWNKRTPDNVRKGIEFFEQAIAEDPSYALAYAGLADGYRALGSIEYGILSPKETVPKARAAAQKALQLQPALVEAQVVLANIDFTYEWDWPAAEKLLKRVIEFRPGYAPAHHAYSHLLGATGRLDEAMAEERRALELDPLSLIVNTQVGMYFYYARRYDEAIEQHRKTIELDPAFLQTRLALGLAYERSGNVEAAVAEFQQALALAPELPMAEALLAYAYAIAGKKNESMKLLEGLQQPGKREFVSPFHMALVYLGLGDKKRVFELLNKASKEHSSYLIYLKVEPLADGLRSDPRFAALLKKMGLGD